jgi:hypothetical protein
MFRKSVLTVMALALLGFVAGCGSSSSSPDPIDPTKSKFIGLWDLTRATDGGRVDLRVESDGTLRWYKHATTTLSATGTWTLEGEQGEKLIFNWQGNGFPLHGNGWATLVNDDFMDFYFVEVEASKTNHLTGPRLE